MVVSDNQCQQRAPALAGEKEGSWKMTDPYELLRSLQEDAVVQFRKALDNEAARQKAAEPELPVRPKGFLLVDHVEWLIEVATRRTRGNVTEAAKLLGVDRGTVYDWVKKRPKLRSVLVAASLRARATAEGGEGAAQGTKPRRIQRSLLREPSGTPSAPFLEAEQLRA